MTQLQIQFRSNLANSLISNFSSNKIFRVKKKVKITQFRETLVDQMLELEKQNEPIVNEP